MSTHDKQDLRPLLRAVLDAEQDEAAEPADAARPEADRGITDKMMKKYGARAPVESTSRISWVAGGGLVAAAAAALYFFIPRPPPSELPEYELRMSGKDSVLGSVPPTGIPTARLEARSLLEIELRPRTDVHAQLAARAVIEHEGKYAVWPAQADIAPNGLLRLRAPVEQLPALPPGSSRLIYVLCQKAALPADAQLLERLSKAPDATKYDFGPQCKVGVGQLELSNRVP